jgi:protein-tyrosine phosphatase
MGNICRSPTAEGVFKQVVMDLKLADKIHIDSAGTHAYHIGKPPDTRAQQTALKRNIDLSSQTARKVNKKDFHHFDYVIAMDHSNYSDLDYLCPDEQKDRLHLFLEFAHNFNEEEVPDPYYGGAQGFEHVLDLVEDASRGLLIDIQHRHNL